MKKLSLEEASFFLNSTGTEIEGFYYKFSTKGKIEIQKKTFFRKVCRFFLLTFGYHRKALTDVVEKVVSFLKEKGVARSLSLIEFIGDKNIVPINLSDDRESTILKKTKKTLFKLDNIYNNLLDYKKTITDLYFRLSRLQIKFLKKQTSEFDLENRIRQVSKNNELLQEISETKILDQLVSIRVLSQNLLIKTNSYLDSEIKQQFHQFKLFKSEVLNFKHQLEDEVASQINKNKVILNRLNLKRVIEEFTQKIEIWNELSKELNDLRSKCNDALTRDHSSYWNEMNSEFNNVYELFYQKYSNLPLEMSLQELNYCAYKIEQATITLDTLIDRVFRCISFLKERNENM